MAQAMLRSQLVAITTEYSLTCGDLTIFIRKSAKATKDIEVCLKHGRQQIVLDYKSWESLSSCALDVETARGLLLGTLAQNWIPSSYDPSLLQHASGQD